MKKAEYTAVILAAGKGSRMVPFSDSFPKPMLPICNKPLIQHQLEIIRSLGIRDIVVVIGQKGFEISKALGNGSALGVTIRYVEQTSCLGIAHAIGCLERHIGGPFLLFLGDIFFRCGKLGEMLEIFENYGEGAVLAVKEEPDAEAMRKNFAVVLSRDGAVTRVIEKPRIAPSRLKGVGIYLFDLTIFDAIRNTPRTAMRDEYELTHFIQLLINDGYPVRAAQCVEDDVNLTYPADLLNCNLEQLRLLSTGSLVADNIYIHPQAQIVESVVGSEVRIEYPIRISRSLIFSGSTVNAKTNLDAHIVTPDGMVDCGTGE